MFPYAECELVHQNTFELLISVMLSAQTTDKQVNIVTKDLFNKYKSPTDYLEVSYEELMDDLRRIGLYRNKAKNIQKTCEMLIHEYDGVVPNTREELVRLPGVGRKTANVVLAVGYDIPAMPVDTHVERIAKRLGFAKPNDSVVVVENKLMELFPENTWNKLHHQLIFFGRYHCKAKKPNCNNCEMNEYCLHIKGHVK